jgi:hypothetical protein
VFSLLLIGRQSLGHWLEDFADGTPITGEKFNNTAPLALSKALAGSQSAFFIMVIDILLVISTVTVNNIRHRHYQASLSSTSRKKYLTIEKRRII